MINPNVALYTLGKGILYIADYNSACPTPTWSDLGNCPRLEVEVTEEKLDHFSSRSGARNKDRVVVLETGYNINFDLDEISQRNLQIFLKAQLVGTTLLRANMVLDSEYQLRFVSDNPTQPRSNEVWEFHRCRLSPGGAFSLISDEWSALSFNGEGLSDDMCNSLSPFFDVQFCTTTTTTTTSTSTTT